LFWWFFFWIFKNWFFYYSSTIGIDFNIKIIEFDDWVDRMHWLNNKPISFKISILPNFYDEFTKKEWLYFNDKSWDVILDWNNLWNISLKTQPYYLFKFLYDNRWEVKTHIEIKKYIKWDDKIQKWNDDFCRTIKNDLPNKNIKSLIKAVKWWYIIK